MANNNENYLKVIGDKKQLKEFKKKTQTKKQTFTLEKLVPTPKAYLKKDDKRWYKWRIKNWGTKWDVYPDSISRDGDEYADEISFDTAWAPPLEWLQKVSKIFPKLTFILSYDEPGMQFKGVAKAVNGKLEDKCIDY